MADVRDVGHVVAAAAVLAGIREARVKVVARFPVEPRCAATLVRVASLTENQIVTIGDPPSLHRTKLTYNEHREELSTAYRL